MQTQLASCGTYISSLTPFSSHELDYYSIWTHSEFTIIVKRRPSPVNYWILKPLKQYLRQFSQIHCLISLKYKPSQPHPHDPKFKWAWFFPRHYPHEYFIFQFPSMIGIHTTWTLHWCLPYWNTYHVNSTMMFTVSNVTQVHWSVCTEGGREGEKMHGINFWKEKTFIC